MKPEQITAYVLASVIIFLVGYSLFALLFFPPEATVSETLYRWGRQHPMLVLAFGVVLGHIFWVHRSYP